MSPRPITEATDKAIIEGWFTRARAMTAADLPAFITELTTEYEHDYGTICHAIAAAGIAAAWAVEHSPAGGITGFQASCIMWEFNKRWMSWNNNPRRLLDVGEMLYPQYAHKFNQISTETWKWLQDQALTNLANSSAETCGPGNHVSVHPDVVAHWQSIVAGVIPFGFTVES